MKCKYDNNEVPPDLLAYGICADCFNGIEGIAASKGLMGKGGHRWRKDEAEISKDEARRGVRHVR